MSHANIEDTLKHIRIYIVIFFSLAVLTVVTVWASHLQISHHLHIIVALTIATVKAALVAAFFMHLISEKKTIYAILGFTGFFFLAMIILTFLTTKTVIHSWLV